MTTLITSTLLTLQAINFTSIYGGRGNYRLLTARPMEFGNFSFDLLFDYYHETYIDSFQGQEFEDRRHFSNGWLGLVYAPLPYTEIYAHGSGFIRYDEKKEEIQIPVEVRKDAHGYGKKSVGGGLKLGLPIFRTANMPIVGYVGGKAGILTSFKPPLSDTVMLNRGFPPIEYHNPDYDLRVLAGLEFGALGVNLNGGYLMRGNDRHTGQQREDLGIYGLSVDLNIKDRHWIFAEGFQAGDSAFYTAGVKLGLGTGFTFNVFMSRGITDPKQWKVASGFSVYSTTTLKPERKTPAYIAGRVVDAQNGTPLVAIVSFPGSDVKSVMTNPDGSYRVGLPSGAYMIYVQASGYKPKERPITVKEGSELIYDLKLSSLKGYRGEPVGRITGRVFSEKEEPIEGEVEILGADVQEVKTEQDGRFKFEVAPGRYEITAHAPGYRSYGKVIYVKEEGEEVEADIYLKEEPVTRPSGFGKISGFVRDKRSEVPIEAEVVADGKSTTTDDMGFYELQIVAGNQELSVNAVDYLERRRIVQVEKGSDIILDFFLSKKKPTGVIIGSVYKFRTMDPVWAKIIAEGKEKKVVNTNPETGIFRMEVSPGVYKISALSDQFGTEEKSITLKQNEIEVITFYVAKPEKTEQIPSKIPSFAPIYFDYGRIQFRYEYYDRLDSTIKFLNQNPDKKIEIRGFTDSVGPEFQNLILSQRRAEAVRDYLINRGVQPARIYARGYGEGYPVGDNRTLYGRELNRRVEFHILP